MTTTERQEELVETGWKPFGPAPSCVSSLFVVLASQKQTVLVLYKKIRQSQRVIRRRNFHKAKSNIHQLAHNRNGQLPGSIGSAKIRDEPR
jgi:hypothetical protein